MSVVTIWFNHIIQIRHRYYSVFKITYILSILKYLYIDVLFQHAITVENAFCVIRSIYIDEQRLQVNLKFQLPFLYCFSVLFQHRNVKSKNCKNNKLTSKRGATARALTKKKGTFFLSFENLSWGSFIQDVSRFQLTRYSSW